MSWLYPCPVPAMAWAEMHVQFSTFDHPEQNHLGLGMCMSIMEIQQSSYKEKHCPWLGIEDLWTWVAFAQPGNTTCEISHGYSLAVQICQSCSKHKGSNVTVPEKRIYYVTRGWHKGTEWNHMATDSGSLKKKNRIHYVFRWGMMNPRFFIANIYRSQGEAVLPLG